MALIHFSYIVLPADTVNGFSFHPYMPMTVTSSGHRRFIGPDNDDEDLCLRGILSNLIASIIYFFVFVNGYVEFIVIIVYFKLS